MKTRWIGILFVVVVVAGIIAWKRNSQPRAAAQNAQAGSSATPQVILVANLREANDKGDNCSVIIHLVRDAGAHGIRIRELSAGSPSPLIKRYHILTIPTLLVLYHRRVVSRYEGESQSTVQKIRTRLAKLEEAHS
ncbi:MAG: hypothetical protein ACLGSH_07320 [Acidobacteriota bacterium]